MKAWNSIRAFFDRLGNYDKRGWKVFFLSLLLAFCIWAIHNLSLTYSDTVDVAVRVRSNLEGRMELSSNTVNIHAQYRTTGFGILRNRWLFSRGEQVLPLDAGALRGKSDGIYYITSRDLQEYSDRIFGDNSKEETYFIDTLFFNFPPRLCRKVPVIFAGELSCRDQYMLSEEVKLYPDSVTVYGEQAHLDRIYAVYTDRVTRLDLVKDVKGSVKLRGVKGVSYSQEAVNYYAPVVRYVELSGRYTLKMVNVPSDKEVYLVPSEVTASFKCAFPPVSSPLETATLYVDYNDFINARGGMCTVHLSGCEGKFIEWDSSPAMAECIVMDR